MASNSVNNKTTLRQLMKQEKQKRIDSPLAKYSNTGQLTCALCNQPISSELYWKAHVNGREHKQKILELKSNIQKPAGEATFVKPLPPSSSVSGPARGVKRSHDVAASEEAAVISKPPVNAVPSSSLPADFFDSAPKAMNETTESTVSANETLNSIPEGFFDDPQSDARVRKVEYVDKMEAEWEKFTREMKQETNISAKLEANDDAEREYEREISETTELITRWQKIEELHDIKDSRFKVKNKTKTKSERNRTSSKEDDQDNDDDLEKELETMFNWRQKRS